MKILKLIMIMTLILLYFLSGSISAKGIQCKPGQIQVGDEDTDNPLCSEVINVTGCPPGTEQLGDNTCIRLGNDSSGTSPSNQPSGYAGPKGGGSGKPGHGGKLPKHPPKPKKITVNDADGRRGCTDADLQTAKAGQCLAKMQSDTENHVPVEKLHVVVCPSPSEVLCCVAAGTPPVNGKRMYICDAEEIQ